MLVLNCIVSKVRQHRRAACIRSMVLDLLARHVIDSSLILVRASISLYTSLPFHEILSTTEQAQLLNILCMNDKCL